MQVLILLYVGTLIIALVFWGMTVRFRGSFINTEIATLSEDYSIFLSFIDQITCKM